MTKTAAIVLAAGEGTRMQSDTPKVLHPITGRPMLLCVLDELASLRPNRVVVVVGPGMDEVAAAARGHKLKPRIAVQNQRLGTGHAVRAAEKALGRFAGSVLILYGDSPLMRASTFRRMRQALARKSKPAVVLLGFEPDDTAQYGRLQFDAEGKLTGIVEYRDLADAEFVSEICNGGAMAIDGRHMFSLLRKIRRNNAKKEFYLTDIVGLACRQGLNCGMVLADPEELTGVNSRAELAYAEALMQERLRLRALDNGATLIDPTTVYFSFDTKLGRDVVVEPNVIFGPGVRVGDRVHIRAFSYLEEAKIDAGAIIGPFARLRPGADIGKDVHIGNFVEIKNARLDDGAKANHLSYVGDARVGAAANIGAGTITCNYDGYLKYRTEIGAGVNIGSNTALVAPVRVGDRAFTGAGSVITQAVPADALALTRAPQNNIAGWAKRKARAMKSKKSANKR